MDEVQKLLLQVEGQHQLEQLNRELSEEEKILRGLRQGLSEGGISLRSYNQIAQESAAEILRLRGAIKDLAGQGGMSGGGILQASYAVQDFTAVLSGGQGLDRAIMSVQNNIPGLLMALGMSGGLAGVVSLVSVGIGALVPLIERMWGAFDDKEAAERAKERLKELQAEIKKAHDAFQKLAEAPTDPEKQAAEGIAMFLKERPNADLAKRAVAAGVTNAEAWSKLTPEERKAFTEAENAATTDVDDYERRETARIDQAERQGTMGPVAAVNARMMLGLRLPALRQQREEAQAKRAGILRSGRERAAESIVAGATQAGPAHAGDRERLLGLTRGQDAFKELQLYTPERIAADEAEYQRQAEADAEEAEQRRQFKERRAQHRREIDQELQDTQAADAEQLREYQQAKRKTQQHQAKVQREGSAAERDIHRRATASDRAIATDAVIDAAAQEGFVGRRAPNYEQTIAMAEEALQNMQRGIDRDTAAMMAVHQMVRMLNQASMMNAQRANQRFEQLAAMGNQLYMGTDHSGQFSTLPPM